MNEDQHYATLVSIRNNEVNFRWTKVQVFFFLHTAALAYVAQFTLGTWKHIIACILGLLFAILWVRLVYIIQNWVEYWDARLASLERNFTFPELVFREDQVSEHKRKNDTNQILFALAGLVSIIWLGLLIISVKAL